jgi:type IV pilus assembly protein PilN
VIRINLLRSFTTGSSDSYAAMVATSDRDQLFVQALKRMAILAIGPAAMLLYEMQSIPVLEAKLKQIQTETSETSAFNQSKSGLAAEIKKYEEEQKKINAQMNFINKIARDKVNELKLFQHLQYTTPESVWINKLEFHDNVLTMNVESDVPSDLDRFSELLTNSGFLSNVQPLDQTIKIDPFSVGVNTTTQNLRAQFTEASEQ